METVTYAGVIVGMQEPDNILLDCASFNVQKHPLPKTLIHYRGHPAPAGFLREGTNLILHINQGELVLAELSLQEFHAEITQCSWPTTMVKLPQDLQEHPIPTNAIQPPPGSLCSQLNGAQVKLYAAGSEIVLAEILSYAQQALPAGYSQQEQASEKIEHPTQTESNPPNKEIQPKEAESCQKPSRVKAHTLVRNANVSENYLADVQVRSFNEVFLLGLAELHIRTGHDVRDPLTRVIQPDNPMLVHSFCNSLDSFKPYQWMPTHEILEIPEFPMLARLLHCRDKNHHYQQLATDFYIGIAIDELKNDYLYGYMFAPISPTNGAIPMIQLLQKGRGFYLIYSDEQLTCDGIDLETLVPTRPPQRPPMVHPFYYQPTTKHAFNKDLCADLVKLLAKDSSSYSPATLRKIVARLEECSEAIPEFKAFAEPLKTSLKGCTFCRAEPAYLICRTKECTVCIDCLMHCLNAELCLCRDRLNISAIIEARKAVTTQCGNCGTRLNGTDAMLLTCRCILCQACCSRTSATRTCVLCSTPWSDLTIQINSA